MCGIVGIWNLNGERVDRVELDQFTDSLRHRGPDGRGTYLSSAAELGLGHRRLSVLDTSDSARQPMVCPNGRFWLVFNGEIYNFLELKDELEKYGHKFKTLSDTEILLAAYLEWGEDCLYKFNGMWAFALWDEKEKTILLSRDRFGVKPLHYHFNGKKLFFASELKAFMALKSKNRPAFDHGIVALMANLECVEKSLLSGVHILGAGETIKISSDGHMKKHKWWRTMDHVIPSEDSYETQVEAYRELFMESCRIRMRSDVPLATALSGGLDSSSVICSMAQLRKGEDIRGRLATDWQRAFIFDYEGTSHSERDLAELVADAVGAKKKITSLGENTGIQLEDIIGATFSLEMIKNAEPFLGPWMLYREMSKNGISVSMDGHGGDELLGGYQHYVEHAIKDALFPYTDFGRYQELVGVREGLVMGTRPEGSKIVRGTFGDSIKEFFPHKKTIKKWLAHKKNHVPNFVLDSLNEMLGTHQKILDDEKWIICEKGDPLEIRCTLGWREKNILGSAGRAMYHDFHNGSLAKILRNFDRATMAHGIESRAPFMDWRLVCMSFSLPTSSKIGNGHTKRILRDAMINVLPNRIRMRKSKIGFASPIATWYRTILREAVLDESRSRQFLESPIWNGERISRYIEQCYKEERYADAAKSWKFIQASILMREFNASATRLHSST